jgi:acetolactate synthase-1/3 small subunit
MKTRFTFSVFTENVLGILTRLTVILTRRQIKMESITACECEVEGVCRYTIVINSTREQAEKIAKQMEKQVEVFAVFFHGDEEIVFREIALYKLPTQKLDARLELVLRKHNASVVALEPAFAIVEKTGHEKEVNELFHELKNFGVLEYTRSGRVAISKPMKPLINYLNEKQIFIN